jgi:hypothetical protein
MPEMLQSGNYLKLVLDIPLFSLLAVTKVA